GGFGLVLVEPGESGAIVRRATLIHGFGKRICTTEHFRGLALHRGKPLLGLLLGLVGADLDHPAAANLLRLGRRRDRGSGRRGRGRRRGGGGRCFRNGWRGGRGWRQERRRRADRARHRKALLGLRLRLRLWFGLDLRLRLWLRLWLRLGLDLRLG